MALPGRGVESQSEIPEITCKLKAIEAVYVSPNVPEEFKNAFVNVWDLECQGKTCEWTDWAKKADEVEELVTAHQKWHEEGMQE